MEEVTPEEKSFLAKKFNEFRLSGLKSYGDYLENELKNSADKPIKKAYNKYIQKELERNSKLIIELS